MEKIEFDFVDVKQLDRLIDGLSAEDKEELATLLFKKLDSQTRSRVIGLSDSGLTVVTGSFVSLNSEIAVNIQNSNSSNLDVEALFRALLENKKAKSKI
jgi:hypothetical protein